MGLFRTAPKAPATVSTDTIVPVHIFDDNAINRSVVLYITLRFDDVLDPERLRSALGRLMEIGDWRKLGARLRMTPHGKLEYHIPAAYDATRPGFGYTHEVHEASINYHPLASRIPRPSDGSAIYSDLGELGNLAHRKDGPKLLEDFLYTDEPQLSLHIVTFQDATLVSISWLHTFLDATAMSSVLNAWAMVLNGQEAEIPSINNFDKDPLSTLGTEPTEPYSLATYLLTGLNKFQFTIRYVFDLVFYRDSQRLLYIPRRHIAAMRTTALQVLATDSKSERDLEHYAPPFVSDGDVLCAYLTRLALKNEGPTSSRQISIMNAFNFRQALSSSLLPPSTGVYLSNAVFTISAFGTASDILTKPLAYTASLIRSSIVQQTTPAQVNALAALTRKAVEQTGWPPSFGTGGTRMVIFSNWVKAGFYKLDFGAAVVRREGHAGPTVPSKPSFVNLSGHSNGLSPRGSWPILGMDHTGGYWIQGNLRSDLWPEVAKELMEMA